jgi:hypothetical protein
MCALRRGLRIAAKEIEANIGYRPPRLVRKYCLQNYVLKTLQFIF